MATFGSFAGLACGAIGALSSSELQVLRLCDAAFSAAATVSSSQQAQCRNYEQQEQSYRHCGDGRGGNDDGSGRPYFDGRGGNDDGEGRPYFVKSALPQFDATDCFDFAIG